MSNMPILDKFHYHEMLDRIHVVMEIVDTHLQQHPAAKIDNTLKDLISEAQDKLWEAYQLTGTKN